MNRITILTAVLGTFGFLAPALAEAATDEVCAPTDEISPTALLRQASLDLRDTIPTIEEYERVLDAADPKAEVDAMISEFLGSEAYYDMIRQYHVSLVWGTLDDSILDNPYNGRARLAEIAATDTWRVGNSRRDYRGRADVECLDQPQTNFGADGRPVPISTFADPTCDDGVCRQEGYVMVAPYWDPENPIKVCAFDAMEVETGENDVACSVYHGGDPLCGCGPNLVWCGPSAANNPGNVALRESLAQEPARIFEGVIREGGSYLDAFTTSTTYVNGPVAQYYRNNSGSSSITTNGGVAYDARVPTLPDLDYMDTQTWVPVQRDGVHAGAFTTLSYLVRFASNRSRANQFYTKFYCAPFVPKEDGLPPEEANPSPNLRERAGCSDCHQTLEPAAAHWGRWRNGGTYGYFDPSEYSFDTPLDTCVCGEGTDRPNCSTFCSTYFVTANNSSDEEFNLYAGLPQAASWLEGNDPANVEAGPAGLVDTPEEARQVAQCTVRNLGELLLGREIRAEDLAWIEAHTDAFEASGYDFNALVTALVADERYRTIR